VLLFSGYNPHRTLIRDHPSVARYSVELRFLANNPATRDLFARRKNALILLSHNVTEEPRRIDWVTNSFEIERLARCR